MVFPLEESEFFPESATQDQGNGNDLLKYLKKQDSDVLARVAKYITPEVKYLISQKVHPLVGTLPSENFNMQIVTERENLASLLASAMMSGYFLRQMEQRMQLDRSLEKDPPL